LKTIATINFKGGVGKTTATWCLGETISNIPSKKSLIFDLDAQMSLTQAITVNVEGKPFRQFEDWLNKCLEHKKTIFHALDAFARPNDKFDFAVGYDFIYKISSNYHFVPSVEDLYWTELEIFDRESVKEFIRRILGKIEHSSKMEKYDVVLFDCPPSFSLLSYSVLSCCDLVLIPINPDFYATKGLNLLLNSLKMRIEPFPVPKIAVFMNKAKPPGGGSYKKFSNETQKYLDDAKDVVSIANNSGLKAIVLETAILDRVGMKRAVQEGIPHTFRQDFIKLWQEIEGFLNER
jgi:chromosome partitioning protein